MAGGRVIFLLLWMYLHHSVEGGDISKREIHADKIHLQKSQPYTKEEPGFLSRIASWIFPFGRSDNSIDSVSSQTHQSGPQYLPPPNLPLSPKYLPPAHQNNFSPPKYLPPNSNPKKSSDCNPCNREPWVPIAGKSGRNTIIQFVPPQGSTDFALDGLNPPPPQHSVPQVDYAPAKGHLTPSSEYHGPPPINIPSSQYGIPPVSQYSPPPLNQYGPPALSSPSILYGAAKNIAPALDLPTKSLSPSSQYGSPLVNQYGPPLPSIHPKPPTNLYDPPAPQFRSKPSPHSSHLGVSSVKHEVKDHMVPPPPPPQRYPQNNYQDIIGMRAPPLPNNIPTTQLNPVKQQSKNPNNIQDILQPTVSQYSIINEDFPPYTRNPLDSNNSPNVHGIEQLPLSSGDNEEFGFPVAFPNLSIRPLVPIHNYVNFHQGIRGGEKVESIQVLPSVPLGDYISSIEHPINVIQSPLVDLSVKNDSEITKLANANSEPGTHQPEYFSTRPNTIQSGLFVNPSINRGQLNEHPIVVDDTHTSASSRNETYQATGHSSKRDNEQDLGIHSTNSQNLLLNARENIGDDLTFIQNGISHTSDINVTENQNSTNKLEFTQPPIDYSQWKPTWSELSMVMSPPPIQSTHLSPVTSTMGPPKKTKHVQIIIPYYNFNSTSQPNTNIWNSDKSNEFNIPFKSNFDTDSYTTLLPVYKPPSSTEQSVWSQFLNDLSISSSKRVTATAFQPPSTTQVYNIQDLLGYQTENYVSQKLPFDILSFQKNIDKWTQQAFSKTTAKHFSSQGVIQNLSPSKKIPEEYLTTVPYDYTTTKPLNNLLSDHDTAGSVINENFKDDIGNNLVLDDPTSTTEELSTLPSTTTLDISSNDTKSSSIIAKGQKSLWDVAQVTVSPVTREKVYIVTPASLKETTLGPVAWSLPPKVENGSGSVDRTLLYEHPKFSIRIEENSTNSRGNGSSTTKVIYSEWPHKINNLQTTTTKPTSRHPLFGLMDVSAYSPPANQIIQTINGHSRVLHDVTPTMAKATRSGKHQ